MIKFILLMQILFCLQLKAQERRIETKEEFDLVLDQLYSKTSSWTEENGAELKVEGLWSEEKPNASAGQKSPNGKQIWTVSINGGLARHPAVTLDAFTMVYCHELGHHMGGFPFFQDTQISAMSVEGQSDYYSSSCVKSLWKEEDQLNQESIKYVSFKDKIACDARYLEKERINLCYRVMNAIRSREALYRYYAKLKPGRFDSEDLSPVKSTMSKHPSHLCRIKTMEAANFCETERPPFFVPGKKKGLSAHGRTAELLSAEFSCVGLTEGARPRCWYAPQIKVFAGVQDVLLTELEGNMDGLPGPGETFSIEAQVKNYGQKPLKNLGLTLERLSQSYRVVEKSRTEFNQISPREIQKTHKMKIEISKHLICGRSVNLLFSFKNGKNEKVQMYPIKLGKVIKSPEVFSRVKKVEIPDINSFGRVARSVIKVKTPQANATKVFIKVDIWHQNRADLMGFLTSPSKNKYVAFRKRELVGEDEATVFELDINEKSIEGNWTLEIKDAIPQNKGRLKSWEISFGQSQCS